MRKRSYRSKQWRSESMSDAEEGDPFDEVRGRVLHMRGVPYHNINMQIKPLHPIAPICAHNTRNGIASINP